MCIHRSSGDSQQIFDIEIVCSQGDKVQHCLVYVDEIFVPLLDSLVQSSFGVIICCFVKLFLMVTARNYRVAVSC